MVRNDEPVYVSLEQAAAIMAVSVKTVRRRISDGTLPAFQCGERLIRVRFDDIEASMRRVPTVRR